MGQNERLHALTSLRWFAAFAVLLRHIGGRGGLFNETLDERIFAQGMVGVSFFFILSGFVLAWSHRSDDTAAAFLQRRFARIYPAYAVGALFSVVFLVSTHARITGKDLFTFTLLQSWFSNTAFRLNSVSWSLSCELFFYVAFPFVLPVVARMSLRDRRITMALCAATPVVIAAVLQPPGSVNTRFWFMYVFPPVRMVEFVVGMLLALEVRDRTWPQINALAAGAIALGGYVAAGFVPRPFMYTAVAVVPFAILIGAVAYRDLGTPIRFLHWKPLLWLGEVSYAFYLVHLTVLLFLREHFSTGVQQLVTLPLGLIVAAAIHVAIEKPLERRLRPRPGVVPTAAVPLSPQPSS